ncbi:MAG: hypothetical protein CM1200mP26_10410 [Acidimicrobiales bacterium]|nr:MAG: hypothetical protein CM1200mP26_10410 [Acidimicrobiales bacterium]
MIGPEAPLVDGLADRFGPPVGWSSDRGPMVPGWKGPKAWMKNVLVDAGVPTAAHGTFTDGV